jgi:DNA polymerase-3 subunit delta
VLILEAGHLKPDDALRQLFEKPAHAAAIACYGDEAGDLASLLREVLGAARLSIAPDAQELLLSRLGADRALSRGEIEKLALYAHGKARIEAEDVEAIVGDASELAIVAAASGDAARAVGEFQRVVDSGESAQGVILAAQRYMQRLHRVRVALDAGKSFEDVVRALRPPLFFKHKTRFGAQTRMWSAAMLTEAMADIAEAAKAARLSSTLEDEIAERLLWSLAQRVRKPAPSAQRR